MSARDTYIASVKAAHATAVVTVIMNETSKQESVNASGVNTSSLAALLVNGNASYVAAVKAAVKAKQAADLAAEHNKQVAIGAARDALRNAGGDSAPF